MVTCSPLMLIRCAIPASRNKSQSLRATAAWSPTASAASTPPTRASSTRSSTASRIARRARSIGRQSVSPSSRGRGPATVLRTEPVAPIPCSNNQRSPSNPCGFRAGAVAATAPATASVGPRADRWVAPPVHPRHHQPATMTATAAVAAPPLGPQPTPLAPRARNVGGRARPAACDRRCRQPSGRGLRGWAPTVRTSAPRHATRCCRTPH